MAGPELADDTDTGALDDVPGTKAGPVELTVTALDVDGDLSWELVNVAADTDGDGFVDITVTAADTDSDPASDFFLLEADTDGDGLVDVTVVSHDWSPEQAPATEQFVEEDI